MQVSFSSPITLIRNWATEFNAGHYVKVRSRNKSDTIDDISICFYGDIFALEKFLKEKLATSGYLVANAYVNDKTHTLMVSVYTVLGRVSTRLRALGCIIENYVRFADNDTVKVLVVNELETLLIELYGLKEKRFITKICRHYSENCIEIKTRKYS